MTLLRERMIEDMTLAGGDGGRKMSLWRSKSAVFLRC